MLFFFARVTKRLSASFCRNRTKTAGGSGNQSEADGYIVGDRLAIILKKKMMAALLVTFLPVALAEPLLLTPILADGKGVALASHSFIFFKFLDR